MKTLAIKRYQFSGYLSIPKENMSNTSADHILVREKEIRFNFSGDPSAPRMVVVGSEPWPAKSVISDIKNRWGEEILQGAEFTVTTVQPILSMFGRVDGYKHQVALRDAPTFGYDFTLEPDVQ